MFIQVNHIQYIMCTLYYVIYYISNRYEWYLKNALDVLVVVLFCLTFKLYFKNIAVKFPCVCLVRQTTGRALYYEKIHTSVKFILPPTVRPKQTRYTLFSAVYWYHCTQSCQLASYTGLPDGRKDSADSDSLNE